MPSDVDRTDGEIDWPPFLERTPPAERTSTSKFSVTLAAAISTIETELEDRLGVDDWRLSTAAAHRKSDGKPYANASPDDPGVVVRWSNDGEQFAIAADQYTRLRDNAREIGLYIHEKRKMANRLVRTGQDEFATARLPSGNEDVIVAGDGGTGTASAKAPHEVLGVAPDADAEVVRGAARQLRAKYHPDTGDDADRDAFIRVTKAKEAMLDG